ncbi:MAG: hypothetical protein H6R45_515, partial [Proteobacteria bacterium]|nr:hypothetical protein [Pseudomonadota bacterium]
GAVPVGLPGAIEAIVAFEHRQAAGKGAGSLGGIGTRDNRNIQSAQFGGGGQDFLPPDREEGRQRGASRRRSRK